MLLPGPRSQGVNKTRVRNVRDLWYKLSMQPPARATAGYTGSTWEPVMTLRHLSCAPLLLSVAVAVFVMKPAKSIRLAHGIAFELLIFITSRKLVCDNRNPCNRTLDKPVGNVHNFSRDHEDI